MPCALSERGPFCAGVFFGAAFALCLLKDIAPPKIRWLIPIPLAAALPFYLGAPCLLPQRSACGLDPAGLRLRKW